MRVVTRMGVENNGTGKKWHLEEMALENWTLFIFFCIVIKKLLNIQFIHAIFVHTYMYIIAQPLGFTLGSIVLYTFAVANVGTKAVVMVTLQSVVRCTHRHLMLRCLDICLV